MIADDFLMARGLIGGALIGVSAVWMMASIGRIAGNSGIFAGVLSPSEKFPWQLAYVIGLISSGVFYAAFAGGVPFQLDAGWLALVAGGLLVGVGTRIGHGCTSGHGVCGMARGSRRSIVATVIFIGSAMLVVAVRRLFV